MEPTFGARVRAARKQLGLSQMAAASKAGINAALLGSIERGQEPTDRSRELIQKNLLAPANMLMGKLKKKDRLAPTPNKSEASQENVNFLSDILAILGSPVAPRFKNVMLTAQRLGITVDQLVKMCEGYLT